MIFDAEGDNSTGVIGADQLKEFGVSYVILSHSEQWSSEILRSTEDLVNKIKYSLENGIKVILCIGESLLERKQNLFLDSVKEKLNDILGALPSFYSKNIIIAYEPIWAIGSSRPASVSDIVTMSIFIKKELKDMNFRDTKIIYGGSINSSNAKEIKNIPDIDGLLVGRASIDVNELNIIANE